MTPCRIVAQVGLTILVVLVCIGPVAAQEGSESFASGLVDVGGYGLYLSCNGTVTPTILVESDLDVSTSKWLIVQSYISRYARICIYDRAGTGKSDPAPAGQRTSQTMVNELHSLLTNAGIEGPLVLVGYGFGTLNARLYTFTYPEDIAGLMLINPIHEDQDFGEAENAGSDAPIFDNASGLTVADWVTSKEQVRAAAANFGTRDNLALQLLTTPESTLSDALIANLLNLSSSGTRRKVDAGGALYQDRPDLFAEIVEDFSTEARGARITLGQGWWEQTTTMLVPHSEHAAAVLDGKIYVAGGLTSNSFVASDVFEVYDPSTAIWSTLVPLPQPHDHHMMAAYNGTIYIIGNRMTGESKPGSVFAYDVATHTWSEVAPMPEPRRAGMAVELDGYIYVVGGVHTDQPPLLRYDPAVDSWVTLAPTSITRDHAAAVVLDGKIYALGGRKMAEEDYASIEIYDPATDTWTPGPDMNESRAGFGATVIDGKIYVAGGEQLADCLVDQPCESAPVVASVEMFDPAVGTWEVVSTMPRPVHGMPAVSLNGGMYILGGSVLGANAVNFGDVYVYYP